MTFVLHPKLEQDSTLIHHLPLCEARLSHNASFPWIILIPRINDMVEIIDLNEQQQIQLLTEIRQTSTIVREHFKPKKLNVANLGNMVEQLHLHVIARFENDLAWPNPVWNSGISSVYRTDEQQSRLILLKQAFKDRYA